MNQKAFGKKINQIRKEQNITSEKLSILCDVNAVFIRQIESGRRLPSVPVLIKICNALNISPGFLLCEDLDINEADQINELNELMKISSPKQIKLISAMLKTMIETMDEQNN